MNGYSRQGSSPILIAGTGAMATLFAWRLANAGRDVTMLGGWQAGILSLRQNGARLVDTRGNEDPLRVRVVESPKELAPVGEALVLVKSWQTERVTKQLAECLSPAGVAVTLQNGLGNYEMLEKELGSERVALGSSTTGATLLGPGLVRPGGDGTISIQSHARIGGIVAQLTAAGFKVEVVENARAVIWSKLIINSAINPLTALLGVPNGELLQRPAARALMRALAQETAAVARAEGVQLGAQDPAEMVERVAERTGSNYSSMLQDVRRGAPTEIEAICGAVMRAGQRRGIPTPLNEACLRLVEALVEGSAVPVDA